MLQYIDRDDVVEIDIGTSENTLTLIRQGSRGIGNILKSVSTPNILSCNEYIKFILNWEDNGNVVVSCDVLLSYASMHVLHLHVCACSASALFSIM